MIGFSRRIVIVAIRSFNVETRIALPSQKRSPKTILKVQLLVTVKTVHTVATQTTPPIIPKTDPLAILAAFFDPEASPTIKTAVIITAGNAANIPARISQGETIVTK